jgi:hypothetical protein
MGISIPNYCNVKVSKKKKEGSKHKILTDNNKKKNNYYLSLCTLIPGDLGFFLYNNTLNS